MPQPAEEYNQVVDYIFFVLQIILLLQHEQQR